MSEPSVTVRYYDCDCDWISKYCDENHQVAVTVPVSVLNAYRK